jgi:putative transposase
LTISSLPKATFTDNSISSLGDAAGTFGPGQSQTGCIYGFNAIGDITNKCGTLFSYGSYRATAGLSASPKLLTVEEILGYFGKRKATAQEKYRRYVQEGIAQNSIWENLEAQSLLGVEGFAEVLRPHVSGKVKMKEIPKGQRLMGRPSLDKLFQKNEASKASRDRAIAEAVSNYGYGQIEVAQYLKLHYATISRLVKSALDAPA